MGILVHKFLSPQVLSLFLHAEEELTSKHLQFDEQRRELLTAASQEEDRLARARHSEDVALVAKLAEDAARLAAQRAQEDEAVANQRQQAAADEVMLLRIKGTLAALSVVQDLEPVAVESPGDRVLTLTLQILEHLWTLRRTSALDNPEFARVLSHLQGIYTDMR